MNSPSLQRPRAREIAAVAVALAALAAAMLWATDGTVLLTRPFWVDEWFTVLVAGARSPAAVLAHLRAGADGGAGLFHLLVWLLNALGGDVTPLALRLLALGLVLGALVAAYAVLRRGFGVAAALGGALAIGAHSLVVAHAYEGRFYGLWLLTCALFAWALARRAERLRTGTAGGAAAVAITAMLMVASHWYGAFTLGLMVAAVVAARGSRWRDAVRVVAPSLLAGVVLLAIAPLAAGQRAAVTVDTWIPAFTMGQFRALAGVYWGARIPIAAVALVAIMLVVRAGRGQSAGARETARVLTDDAGIVALLSLALLPFVLAALSLVGLPSMIGRYGVPAVLAWGPLVALALELCGRWPARVGAVVLLGFWFVGYTREAQRKRAFAVGVAEEARVAQQAAALRLPLVFQSVHTMYPAVAGDSARESRAAYLDLPDATLDALVPDTSRWYQLNKGLWLERDFARVHARRFGFPSLVTPAALDTTARFLLFASAARLPRGVHEVSGLARAVFPRHRVSPVTEQLLLLEREPARSPPARSTSR